MEETGIRLYYLREILRRTPISIDHVEKDTYAKTSFKFQERSEHKEYVVPWTSYSSGGGGGGSYTWIHDAAKQLLKLINDNHDVKVEDIYNSESKGRIDIIWPETLNNTPIATPFGNFSSSLRSKKQQEEIQNYFTTVKETQNSHYNKAKFMASTFSQFRKDNNCDDSDEVINQEPDLTKWYNADLRLKPEIYNWLPEKFQKEYMDNYDDKYTNRDWNAHRAAIKSKDMDLIQYMAKVTTFDPYIVRIACEVGNLDAVKFYIEEYGVKLTVEYQQKCLSSAFLSDNESILEYLLNQEFDRSRMGNYFTYRRSERWPLLISLHERFKFDIPEEAFCNSTVEETQWLITRGVKRNEGVVSTTCDGKFEILNILLDTPGINYETPESRFDLIWEVLKGYLYDRYHSRAYKSRILEILLERDILNPIYKEIVLDHISDFTYKKKIVRNHIYDTKWKAFKLMATISEPTQWDSFLDFETSLHILSEYKDYDLFDRCTTVDLDVLFEICQTSPIGLSKITHLFNEKYGPEWYDKIPKHYHHMAIYHQRQKAIDLGYKLYRSFSNICPPNISEESFCLGNVTEDVSDEITQKQKKLLDEINFHGKNIALDTISSNHTYHVRVTMVNCYKDKEGFWRNFIVYDIPNAKLINIKDHFEMFGSNNGTVDRTFREGESKWINEDKKFYLTKYGGFHTGRDGGSLNCCGGYHVRVKLND